MILQTGFLDIYSGPETWIKFLRMNSPLRWLLWEGLFNLRGGGANIYLSQLNAWSCRSTYRYHRLYILVFTIMQYLTHSTCLMLWAVYEVAFYARFTHLFCLQCVCSPCAFTQESATDLWLFTTNTFIHYFDFKSKHFHRICFQHYNYFALAGQRLRRCAACCAKSLTAGGSSLSINEDLLSHCETNIVNLHQITSSICMAFLM